MDEDEADVVQMIIMEMPCSSLLWKNKRLDEGCANITQREVAFDGELAACVVEEVFLTPEERAAHRDVLNVINNVRCVCSTKMLPDLSAPMVVS